ncbi:hypothetical protein ACFKHW_28875 [Bradyrhizobium lupini]|uniref:hypothetical protein n=1 Tax=Rhizobium lupini TaxID=136996 RepID=UPI00366B32A7
MKAIMDLDLRFAIAKQRSLCAEFVWPAEARASPFSSPSAFSGLSVGTGDPLPAIDLGLIDPVVQPLRVQPIWPQSTSLPPCAKGCSLA